MLISIQAVTDFFDAQGDSIFNLYKCEAQPQDPPFVEAIDIYENNIRRHFIFSTDHGSGFVIPEIITKPFGLRPGGFYEDQLNEGEAATFLENVYRYAIEIYRHLPLTRNVQVNLSKLSVIGGLFNIIPNSLGIMATGTMRLLPVHREPPVRPRIYPQLNTIVDLTHFSGRPQMGLRDPLQELIRLSKRHLFTWLPPELGTNSLIDYELAILTFTREIVDNMSARLRRAPHMSDPWIRGAIGLSIWSVLSLCIGGRKPQETQKNLWVLMPKINIIDFLTGAFEANQNLPPPANNYYFELIINFFPAFQEVYNLLPQNGQLRQSLQNSVLVEEENLISYRLKRWFDRTLPRHCPPLNPNDLNTIKILIIATLICGTPQIRWQDLRIDIPILKDIFGSYTNLYNSCKFMADIFSMCERLSIKGRGGYGRPKFELRSGSFISIRPGAYPEEPDYDWYVNVFDAVSRPAVAIPLPPDIPAEYQQRVFPAASVDSARSASLYGGRVAPARRKKFHSVWFPGIPDYEHGRRSAARVQEWVDEQNDISDATQAREESNRSLKIQAHIQTQLEQMRALHSQQNILINELRKINVRAGGYHFFVKKKLLAIELKGRTEQINAQMEILDTQIQELFLKGREALDSAHEAAVSSRTFARQPGTFALQVTPNRNAAITAAAVAETAYEHSIKLYNQMLILSNESKKVVRNLNEITIQINAAIGRF